MVKTLYSILHRSLDLTKEFNYAIMYRKNQKTKNKDGFLKECNKGENQVDWY